MLQLLFMFIYLICVQSKRFLHRQKAGYHGKYYDDTQDNAVHAKGFKIVLFDKPDEEFDCPDGYKEGHNKTNDKDTPFGRSNRRAFQHKF